jgi:short-subunit dehydrogenase
MSTLNHRGVLVTGASSGIGRELAWALARRGCRLALVARRRQRLESLAAEIAATGLNAPWIAGCDVGQWQQVESLRDQIGGSFGPVEVLVNNAGRGAWGPFAEAAVLELEAVVRTNLLGPIYCTRAFAPAMVARGAGTVVFVSSVLGAFPAVDHAVYGASKFGVSGLAENLAYELEPSGVRVLLVEPGLVPTEFGQVSGVPDARYQRLPRTSATRMAERIARGIETGRRRVGPDPMAEVALRARRHFPRLVRRMLRPAFARLRRG